MALKMQMFFLVRKIVIHANCLIITSTCNRYLDMSEYRNLYIKFVDYRIYSRYNSWEDSIWSNNRPRYVVDLGTKCTLVIPHC